MDLPRRAMQNGHLTRILYRVPYVLPKVILREWHMMFYESASGIRGFGDFAIREATLRGKRHMRFLPSSQMQLINVMD